MYPGLSGAPENPGHIFVTDPAYLPIPVRIKTV